MIVVADTSVVLNLARVSQAELLRTLYHEVWIPPAVQREFLWQASVNPRFHGLQPPLWLQVREPVAILGSVQAHPHLDAGERAALSLAVELHADAVLIDEQNGRAMADQLGLNRIGILGILVRAKQRSLVSAIAPVLDKLHHEAGFWMDEPLRQHILQLAGEAP